MKLITFKYDGRVKLGAIENEMIYDLHLLDQNKRFKRNYVVL